MIELSSNLTNYINNYLNINEKSFDEDVLSNVTKLELAKEDIAFLKFFPNLKSIEFNSFPSINQYDLDNVAMYVPKLKILSLKNQSAIISIDLSMFFYLEELCLVCNDNLINIFNIEKLEYLKYINIYNNKKFDISNLYKYIKELKYDFKLDLIYYYSVVQYLIDNNIDISEYFFDKIKFVDCYGYRNIHVKTLKKNELINLINNICDIVSLYCFNDDSDIKKFCVLHKWMLDNIVYINEDVEEHLDYYGVVDAFIHKKAGRLSYARVFQLLLIFAGINTNLVYSSGVTNLIGKYQNVDLLSFDGKGDYAMVKSNIDGKYYYTDIAWNKRSLEENCYDDLKILLVSKADLLLKHSLVGEGIVDKSFTYNYKAIEDVNEEVKNHIHDVDYMFDEVLVSDNSIDSAKKIFANNNEEVNELKRRINEEEVGTELYNSLVDELISLEKVINSYNSILSKYNEAQKDIIKKYSEFILNNYIGVFEISKINENIINKLELKNKYHVISKYLYDLLKMYLSINNVK